MPLRIRADVTRVANTFTCRGLNPGAELHYLVQNYFIFHNTCVCEITLEIYVNLLWRHL